MKVRERFIWATTVSILFAALFFGVFVSNACAANISNDSAHIQKLKRVLNYIKQDFVDKEKIDEEKLINGAIKGMLEALEDPHTVYLTEENMEDMTTTSTGTFGGVGMIISEKDDYIIVVTPIEDTPAYRKGMKSGDLIISVDGQSIKGISVSEAAKRLKGKPGTKVKIEFIRDEVKYETELLRAIIDVPTVKYTTIDDDYGYLRITQFTGTTDKHVKEALLDFKQKKIKGIIVDLRYNPGGLLSQVITIVDYFQNNGVIVSTKGRKLSENSIYKATKFNTIVDMDIPVMVLIDNGSASASEIFSGAMKDLKRGILIGEKTYGKGSVQTIRRLNKDGFKITISKYYTPSDVCIDGIGITPDIIIKEPELSEEEKEALRRLYQIQFYLTIYF